MRDARYVRLISWTLQSGSEQVGHLNMVTGALLLFTYICNYSQHYVLCARWVLVVTLDSSSSLLGCSMRVLPPPLLLINCLSCSPLGGPGPLPFPPPPRVDPIFLRVQAPTCFLVGGNGPSQIIDLLKTFDRKSTPDIDGISIELLKFVSHEIAVLLSHIFNLSITLGIFPDRFKFSRILPVFKAGDHSLCDNYRPIALVSHSPNSWRKLYTN